MSLAGGSVNQDSGPSIQSKRGGLLIRFWFGLLMLAPILVATTLVALFPPDGNERGEWLQFIGHFHPLTVHFPIALFLLVPVLEVVGRFSGLAHLRVSVNFILALATLGAASAAILGWCLGRSGGYSGALITQHMWGGILVAIICWVCWLLRTRLPELEAAYTVMLALGVGLVILTGYRGGQLSLGPNHLTQHMPEALRNLLGVNDDRAAVPSADPNTFYGARIQPIFTARCISCHGADKQKANLRLDSYQALMRGGKHGPPIQAGSVQTSDLFHRITLPASHDDFMPKGKQPLSADQVKAIELWIASGASATLAVDAIKNVPSGSATREVKIEEVDPSAVARERSSIAPAVADLQKKFPNILDYDSRGSADLRLNASVLGSAFGDQELEAFAPVADHIIVADLSRTAVTDHSASTLAAMKRLQLLRLMGTGITDVTVLRLDSLNQLESLNVYGTQVTAAVLPAIAKLPKLSYFYAGHTAILPGKSVPENLVGKLVF
jgi:uncharacterized membrane protein